MKEINIDNPIGAEKARQLPDPKGYRMLIMLPQMEEKTEGGVILPDEHRAREETATIVGFVLKMGDLCYKDPDKFPTGAWCKEGDWVVFARYGGSRLNIEGGEIRVLNDDEILAVVSDPEDILHM